MAGFNFFLNGTKIVEPRGFNDFTEDLLLDLEKRILRFDYPLQLTFFGDGYKLLEEAYQADINSVLTLLILDDRKGQNKVVANCLIRMIDCEWNITKEEVICDIDDATFQGLIFNRFKVEVFVDVNKTIDGTEMTPVSPFDMTVYNPDTGANLPDTRKAWDVKEVLTSVITYLSNNTIGFESTWYDELPGNERMALVTGLELRAHEGLAAPLVSLEELFENLWKKDNLILIIENPLLAPVLRIERWDYLFADEIPSIVINNIANLKRSLDFEQLYGVVNLGSEEYIKEFGSTYAMPYFQFFSFAEETYHISGNTGNNTALDLVTNYVIDSNAIQATLNADDKWDEDVFLIQYDVATNTAHKSGEFYHNLYNFRLMNMNVAQRFNLYGDLILNSGIAETDFRAEQTIPTFNQAFFNVVPAFPSYTNVQLQSAFPYNDDSTPPNFDEANAYDNTTYQYTTPVSGIFRFRASIRVEITAAALIGPNYGMRVIAPYTVDGVTDVYPSEYVITRTINGNTLSQTVPATIPVYIDNIGIVGSVIEATWERSITLQVGQTVQVRCEISASNTSGDPQVLGLKFIGGYFETVETPTSGGDWQTFDPNLAYVNVYQAERLGIDESAWEVAREDGRVKYKIDTGRNDPRIAFARRISRQFITGETKIELIYNRNQSYI